jgi:hypothetical protein
VRAQLRTVLVVLLTAVAVGYTAPDIMLPWHPWANYGFTEAPASQTTATVTSVTPGGSAALAGVRVGDTIDLGAMTFADRRYTWAGEYGVAATGDRATFVFVRDGKHRRVTLLSEPHARMLADNATDVVQILTLVCFPLLAMTLLLMRPGVLTWAFFIYALDSANGSLTALSYAPIPLEIAFQLWTSTFSVAGLAAFVVFALRFPTGVLTKRRQAIERAVLWTAVPVLAASLYATLATVFLLPFAGAANAVGNAVIAAGYTVGALAFLTTLVHATPQERPRVVWVVFGFLVGYAGMGIFTALNAAGVVIPIWLTNGLQIFNLLVPVTVMYAILKHRVIDIRFFLNRALVYGLLTTIGVGLLVLLDWAVAKPLERYGIIVEVAGALVLGFGIQRLHGFIDALVDRFVFRSVHEAERHLERVGKAMTYAESLEALDRLLVEESARALQLRSAAVFRRSGDAFTRVAAVGWSDGDVRTLEAGDPVVLDLQAQRRGIGADPFLMRHSDFPRGAGAPAFAVPICIREHVMGFALFGAHNNASDVDPNEQSLLESFVERAAIAYDHVSNVERAAENARMRIELDFLRGLVRPLGPSAEVAPD